MISVAVLDEGALIKQFVIGRGLRVVCLEPSNGAEELTSEHISNNLPGIGCKGNGGFMKHRNVVFFGLLFFSLSMAATAGFGADAKDGWMNWSAVEEHLKAHVDWSSGMLKKGDMEGSCKMMELSMPDRDRMSQKLSDDKTYSSLGQVINLLKD